MGVEVLAGWGAGVGLVISGGRLVFGRHAPLE